MLRLSKGTTALLAGVLGTALLAIPPASGQSGPGWTTLVDGKTIGDWDRIGEANWRIEDGALVADKGKSAHLVSKSSYKNFQIHAEFWVNTEANSGIFFRCPDPKNVSARTCYEANIFDTRKDPSYGTGSIVNFAEVKPMPKAGGKWNTMLITAKDRHITVVLNGKKTVDMRNGMFEEGRFTLQYSGGIVKFRKVAIKPL